MVRYGVEYWLKRQARERIQREQRDFKALCTFLNKIRVILLKVLKLLLYGLIYALVGVVWTILKFAEVIFWVWDGFRHKPRQTPLSRNITIQ